MLHSSARDPAFDARWAAWVARGTAHDERVRRRFMIIGPLVVVVAVTIGLFLAL